MTQLRLLGLSGSLRRASNSTAVLHGLQDALAPKAALDVFPLHGMPLYNEDDDGEHAPEQVRALRSAIATSDGVILISPEYNHGMSGVLKNALDWASRPYGRSTLMRKPVLTMTASPAFTGGVRAQQQMNETLLSIPARPVLRPQIVIGGVHEKVRDGRLIDEAVLVRPLERHVSHAAPSTLCRQKDQIRKLRAYCPAARLVPNVLVRGGIVHASWRARNLDSKTAAALDQRFDGVITTETDLRKIVGPASRWFTSKILTKLDRQCRDFIAASPFIAVGSTDPSGMVDLSPKGDSAGFVRCLDDTTLAIPDRRGNRRVDTFQNMRQNPGIGLILFVPGQRETLRVTGRAIVVRDRNIRNAMADHGQMPDLAMIVKVEKAFFHCGKCITRSKFWNSRL